MRDSSDTLLLPLNYLGGTETILGRVRPVKAWKKTSPELVAAFDKALPASLGITRRPMFGYASAFVNGNWFAGTFQDANGGLLSEALDADTGVDGLGCVDPDVPDRSAATVDAYTDRVTVGHREHQNALAGGRSRRGSCRR